MTAHCNNWALSRSWVSRILTRKRSSYLLKRCCHLVLPFVHYYLPGNRYCRACRFVYVLQVSLEEQHFFCGQSTRRNLSCKGASDWFKVPAPACAHLRHYPNMYQTSLDPLKGRVKPYHLEPGLADLGVDLWVPGREVYFGCCRINWLRKDLSVVLVNPQIPQNTGNIFCTTVLVRRPMLL